MPSVPRLLLHLDWTIGCSYMSARQLCNNCQLSQLFKLHDSLANCCSYRPALLNVAATSQIDQLLQLHVSFTNCFCSYIPARHIVAAARWLDYAVVAATNQIHQLLHLHTRQTQLHASCCSYMPDFIKGLQLRPN
jgi:hypothetical protein